MRARLALLVAAVMLCQLASPADAQRRRRKKARRSKPRKQKPKPAPKPDPTPASPDAAAPAPAPESGGDAAPPEDDAKLKGKARVIGKTKSGDKEKLFDFTGFELSGSTRMPQLLYFLDRANHELERASLQRRSFVPEMVRTLDEEAL